MDEKRVFTAVATLLMPAMVATAIRAATRVFGNFFTSLNLTIGQLLLLAYLWHAGLGFDATAVRVVAVLAVAAGISAWFRLHNAASIVPLVEKESGPDKG